MLERREQTIVAPATLKAEMALGIVRLSGKDALSIVSKVFKPKNKQLKDFTKALSHHCYFGEIIFEQKIIDEVVASVFLNPHSFTGEDIVEISHHGSPYIQDKIIQAMLSSGARLAERGEFSERAFLNGKINLSQAEAIADIIACRNDYTHSLAIKQLRGAYTEAIKELRDKFLKIASLLELEIDFSEEHEIFVDRKELQQQLSQAENMLQELLNSFEQGNAFKQGIPIAIVGEPNSGKSTLMNALVKEDRSIVSSIKGTTRDTIEEVITLNGMDYRFIDTAGIREGKDEIEIQGIQRSFQAIDKAKIILLIQDITEVYDSKDISKTIELLNKNEQELLKDIDGKYVIKILNKIDSININKKALSTLKKENYIIISALKKEGISDIVEAITTKFNLEDFNNKVIISNHRHYEVMHKALQEIILAKEINETGFSSDIMAENIRQASEYLSQITGEITTTEILTNIFSNFCIGK